MDDLEETDSNVWARQSPENTLNSKKNNNQDNDDDGLWNANDDDDTADLNDEFTQAASTLSISQNNDEHTVESDLQSAEAGPSKPCEEPLAKSLASFDDFDDNEDDDDDFGEPAGAGEANGNDDDDFGAFDEADQDADFGDAFASSSSAQAEAGPSTLPETVHDTSQKPLLRLIDFEEVGTTREQIRPHIEALFSEVWPDWADNVSADIPMPNGTDKENILVTEYNMQKYHDWVEKPPDFEPFDWKRSTIRRNMMQALGIPVNLDDLAPPKAMPNLVLPSIHTTPASPSKSKSSNSLSASAPASSVPAQSSISRSASPARPSIPPIDIPKAKSLSEFPESEMKFKTLAELEVLRKDLQEVAIQASTHLTALLEKKEILSGQSETYNAMIQDLVREAQKMRSPANAGKGSSVKRSNSTTSKTTTSTTNTAPRSGFFGGGGGSTSRPNSRPASPAPPALGVKTAVSKSSASAPSPAKEARRSSLW